MSGQQKELVNKAKWQAEQWWQQMMLPQAELNVPKAPARYRAELRRCGSADAAMLTEGFRVLWLALPAEIREQHSYSIEAWATVAAILSHVSQAQEKTFGASLGQLDAKTDKAVVSELRLQQLQGAKTSQDFFRRLHRLVRQLGGKANPEALIADILDWFGEHYTQQPRRADKRVAVRWALDYYSVQAHA
ncbi:type I-E CRISPR-associated protein Cse2/CasB [Rheinheimera riviphila]|uniref:Type I-E CRISPR-associated protein Cse2/CasB n=1 Tax=Rheinheimera riviphila TaxID=1834037 RepID=A0A437QMD2_9GAMM|nr:type I-E CRISPR-associated protein Cse2/CasB [Rheinheimera riviphila]RVU35684.1 type I-E CRISPR-associated protein Cse2/CasB [Rheinheimera riviphila]